jgi:hypothetical protein
MLDGEMTKLFRHLAICPSCTLQFTLLLISELSHKTIKSIQFHSVEWGFEGVKNQFVLIENLFSYPQIVTP